MYTPGLIILMVLFSFVATDVPPTDTSDTYFESHGYLPFYRSFRKRLWNSYGSTAENEIKLEKARMGNKLQEVVPDSVPFPCDTRNMRSKYRPASVHKLRPGDIDVIGAMGDSLSAGSGIAASNVMDITTENRGLAASSGGFGTWRQFLTLPNIVKEFNPNLYGYATGDCMSIEPAAKFNVAEPGAMSVDMPFMAKELVRRIKNDPKVNFNLDWKFISLFIGGNDFCAEVCYQKNPEKWAELHRRDLLQAFRYIKDNMPRTIVNLILAPDFIKFSNFTNNGRCMFLRITECPCLFANNFASDVPKFRKPMEIYRSIEKEVSRIPEFTQNDTFTVILQAFTDGADWPVDAENKTDINYFSVDCFHFSQKMNAAMTNSVWNNMLEPVGKKTLGLAKIWKPFLCPSEAHPYIYTLMNSQ